MDENEDPPPVTGAVDAAAPWTIENISVETRNLVVAAARRDGLTVGQWLDRRVREWEADGSPAVSPSQPGMARPLTVVGPAAAPRSDLDDLRELVRMARELTPADKDTDVLRAARRVVRDRLRAMRAVPQRESRSAHALLAAMAEALTETGPVGAPAAVVASG